MSTKRLRNRRDDADFADSVFKDITAGGLAAFMLDLAQRHEVGHAANHFVESDDDLGRPDSVFLQRHEFDKADDDALFAGKATETGDLVVVEAAKKNTIHLDRV